MTNITIYDCDYKRIRNLMYYVDEDCIAELIANALDSYEDEFSTLASRVDLILRRDDLYFDEGNLFMIDTFCNQEFEQDACISVMFQEDRYNVHTLKMVKTNADWIWVEFVDE